MEKIEQQKNVFDQNKIEDNAFMAMASILNYDDLYINYYLNFTKNYFPDVYQILTTQDCRDFSVLAGNIDVIENSVHTYLNEAMAIKRVSDRVALNHGYDAKAFQNYVMNNLELAEQMVEVADAEINRANGAKIGKCPTISAELVAGYEQSNQFDKPKNTRKSNKQQQGYAEEQITIDM